MEENSNTEAKSEHSFKTESPGKGRKFSKKTLIVAVVLVLIVGALASFDVTQMQSAKDSKAKVAELEAKTSELQKSVEAKEKELQDLKESTGEAYIDKNNFQAVFLKDGQVYFGKITKMTKSQITLENIYYLRTDGGGEESLVKLGKELHGPQDVMYIERKEVTFWENLKKDGEVAKAIADYEKKTPN